MSHSAAAVSENAVKSCDPVKVKIECDENSVQSRVRHCVNIDRAGANSEAKPSIKVLDELDHVVLKDRLKMLITRFASTQL